MAKTSIIERAKKRVKVVAKYAAKRAELKKIVGDRNASDDERWQAQMQLQKQPRDGSTSPSASPLWRNRAAAGCLP